MEAATRTEGPGRSLLGTEEENLGRFHERKRVLR